MEERQSRLSNMDWKRFRPYLCVRLIPQNSMFSNFCHVLNMKIEMKEIRQKQSNPYPHMENQKKEVTKRAIEINAEIKMTSL